MTMEENRIFASFDERGLPVGFWQSAAYDPKDSPPENWVEISEGHFEELSAHQGQRRWDGATVVLYEPPPPTLEEMRESMPVLTARQFRLGLVNAGISPSQVSATIAAMPAGSDKEKAQIEWEYATTFRRMHPLIATVGAALGLSATQIDAMWLAAVSL